MRFRHGELTQIQSMLQNQITSLGNFVFQDGSPVSGGHISVDNTVIALQLQPQFANVDIDVTNFLVNGNNTLIINASGATTVKAVVVAIDETQINPIIVVKYLTGTTFQDGDTIQVATGVQTQASLISANSSSGASVASINEGVFYSGGFFVDVSPQTILLTSANNVPTYRVGLTISETIVDETQDTNLLDPAQGSFNYQAPGATRYQYNLTLDKRDLSSVDDSAFYELLRVENGLITKYIDYPIYGDLGATLAERTYDQSGDFVTKPFIVSAKQNQSNSSQFSLVISPGKAYVKGYEFQTIATQVLQSDRALSTNSVTNYSMSLEYGNIMTVNNVHGGNTTGIFDITEFQPVDLHCVQSGSILSANASIYNSTKIGTAGIRNIEFLGLGDYYVYIVNTNLSQNTFQAVTGNAISLQFPVNYSNVTNAFVNVNITVNTGGIIDQRIITNYVSPNVAFLNLPLSTNATSSSNVTLSFGIKDTESLVVTPASFTTNVFATQNSVSAIYACMDIALAGKDFTGNAQLTDTQFNNMIYELPQNYVAQGSINGATFYSRKNLWSQTFTFNSVNTANLIITSGSGLGSGESFPYGFTTQFLTDALANTNFIIVVRNAMTSNLANGQIINFNRGTIGGGNGIYQSSNLSVTAVVSSNASFVGDILFTVLETNANSTAVARRTKTLIGNTSNSTLLSTDSYLNGVAVIGTSNAAAVYIDAANGYVWYPSYYDMALTPGAIQSLYVPDVYSIIKVYSSGSPTTQPNVLNAIDITNNYYLNSGQNDNFYDHASLILKPGVYPPTGQTVVMMQYFSHDSVQGFFDADSYSSTLYQNEAIPYYASQKFGTFTLRDCIDFRPTRQLGSLATVTSDTFYGLKTPQPDNTITLSYQFYLPRIDKLMLNKTGVFTIEEGTPSQYPPTPTDSDDAMTLYILTIPAYTANVSAIAMQYVENKVYTMKDIGVLDTRIQNLEVYSSLSSQESLISSQKILYKNGVTAKDPYGIITDDFSSFSVADNKSTDLQAYFQPGTLSPMKAQNALKLNYVKASGSSAQKNDKTYSLAFTEVPAIVQNTASESLSVQPYLFAQFTGTVKLSPSTDYWFSSRLVPQIIAPASSIVDVPLTVVPPSAPDLVPANASPSAPVITNSFSQANSYITTSLYNTGINTGQVEYFNKTLLSYGLISTISNWFGAPVQTSNVSQTILTNNLGTTIQLAPGVGRNGGVSTNTTIKVL